MASNATPQKRTIVVAGDIVVDHHLYEGQRTAPTPGGGRGVWEVREPGGACLVEHLLKEILSQAGEAARTARDEAQRKHQAELLTNKSATQPKHSLSVEESFEIRPGVKPPACQGLPCGDHAYAVWKPYPNGAESKVSFWRANQVMGYGDDGTGVNNAGATAPRPVRGLPAADLLVLDDAGFMFRHNAAKSCWRLPPTDAPTYVLLKMASAVAQGDLWNKLIKQCPGKLVCVIAASDFRRECASLSQGLSWERTISDLRAEMRQNPLLRPLERCQHLVVSFSSDGALWLDQSNKDDVHAWFVGNTTGAEGELSGSLEGSVFGFSSCLVASLAHGLLGPLAKASQDPPALDLAPAIAAGLSAMRDLAEQGHGPVGDVPPSGYPADRLAQVILKSSGSFRPIPVPWAGLDSESPNWMIVETSQRPLGSRVQPSLLGLARQVVLHGTDAIKALPHACFGKMTTADRQEIEALRNIRKLMLDYRDTPGANKPLSIGVFGPPGAGKSFGVKQLANHVFTDKAWLEFNLSQFGDTPDLIGAFHQVRDKVLGGLTPVVFWDEFDAREYKWLQYLLAPMQDGRFQDGQLNHAIGKCVFVFAGATSWSYAAFGPSAADGSDALRDFRLAKGPDFHSRLDAFYDVLGPNPRTLPPGRNGKRERDPSDLGWPLRRALLIRDKLGCERDARLDFDPDLLDALVRVPEYAHGARSVEKLVTALRPADGRTVRRSSLPAPDSLGMHVNAEQFATILSESVGFRQATAIDKLAPAIHDTWQALSKKRKSAMQPHFAKKYGDLSPVDQEENRAAARRIPEVLALAGMGLEPDPRGKHADGVVAQLKHHLERLAEAEHDGWMAHRLQNGWRYDPKRDDDKKLHHALVPYSDLSREDKEKDCNSVNHFPEMVKLAGYRIVFLDQA